MWDSPAHKDLDILVLVKAKIKYTTKRGAGSTKERILFLALFVMAEALNAGTRLHE
jgi:hypothetical protein